ncbi:MADS-box transcription factor 23 [Gossypium hirsutum]|uniref:MADS-box transcription factor 23 n=1 Tax=Gossypium hirsutum TaxID=3635 RepID=A0ABM3A9G4_GOSHI|nr:MADS-box transcription factor 23-like [Gossypium hirsutum]
MASSDKKTKGKQKIEIKIIENADDRLIAFSKRRTGIYKKISELSILCGGEILFIIFSPAGKPYSFGHPSVESVAKCFPNAGQHLEETIDAPVETYRKERINLLVQDFTDVQDQLDVIKEKQMEIALAQRSHGTEIRQHLEETTDASVQTYRKERINLLVQDFTDVQDQLDVIKEKQMEIALAQRSHGTEIRHWWKAPIDQLIVKELYEQDECFAEFNKLIFITRNKKIATISSMQAPMDEDIPSFFPPIYGPNLQ